jgi:hypothetical protein
MVLKKSIFLFSSVAVIGTSLFSNEMVRTLPEANWQLLGYNQEIDLAESLKGTPVKIVWGWDNEKGDWIGYSPEYSTRKKLEDMNITVVDSFPANQGFWISSYEETDVTFQEVYYPLYDMCVNVNSPEFWQNSEENLTQPYEKCSSYLDTLEEFMVVEGTETLEYTDPTVSGSFSTNLPVVFVGNFDTNMTTTLNDFNQLTDVSSYIKVDGEIENVSLTVSGEMNDMVNFSFDVIDHNESFHNSIKLVLGYDSNFTQSYDLNISTVGIW